ncbi:MAG: hypothetical protein ACUVWB_11390 [Anaerolineae bacterium]
MTVRKERLLPRSGQVLVRAGEILSAEDLIGRCHPQPRWHCVDVARQLGLTPEAAETALQKHPGDVVEKGEFLAVRKGGLGLFRRVCKAPATGTVVAYHAGRLLIEEQGESQDVRALVRGRVVHVRPGLGAVIEVRGAYLRGAWGAGPSSYGVLKVLVDTPTTPLLIKDIDIGAHGAVIAGGWCADGDVLRQAEQVQARGIILGSLDIDLRPLAEKLAIPVVITEGFGGIPMNPEAFDLLRSYHGRDVSVFTSGAGLGPEIFLPDSLDEPPPPPEKPAPLTAGQKVRIIGYPRLGAVGRVVEVLDTPRRVEAGVLYEGVMVKLDHHETVFVPWMNVEPIGPRASS